jgi:hypothetical protein
MGRVLSRIEGVLLHSSYTRGRLYTPWLSLTGFDRDHVKRRIAQVIKADLFGVGLQRAIAETVIDAQGTVHLDLPIYRYVRNTLCKGSARQALALLESWRRLREG